MKKKKNKGIILIGGDIDSFEHWYYEGFEPLVKERIKKKKNKKLEPIGFEDVMNRATAEHCLAMWKSMQ